MAPDKDFLKNLDTSDSIVSIKGDWLIIKIKLDKLLKKLDPATLSSLVSGQNGETKSHKSRSPEPSSRKNKMRPDALDKKKSKGPPKKLDTPQSIEKQRVLSKVLFGDSTALKKDAPAKSRSSSADGSKTPKELESTSKKNGNVPEMSADSKKSTTDSPRYRLIPLPSALSNSEEEAKAALALSKAHKKQLEENKPSKSAKKSKRLASSTERDSSAERETGKKKDSTKKQVAASPDRDVSSPELGSIAFRKKESPKKDDNRATVQNGKSKKERNSSTERRPRSRTAQKGGKKKGEEKPRKRRHSRSSSSEPPRDLKRKQTDDTENEDSEKEMSRPVTPDINLDASDGLPGSEPTDNSTPEKDRDDISPPPVSYKDFLKKLNDDEQVEAHIPFDKRKPEMKLFNILASPAAKRLPVEDGKVLEKFLLKGKAKATLLKQSRRNSQSSEEPKPAEVPDTPQEEKPNAEPTENFEKEEEIPDKVAPEDPKVLPPNDSEEPPKEPEELKTENPNEVQGDEPMEVQNSEAQENEEGEL